MHAVWWPANCEVSSCSQWGKIIPYRAEGGRKRGKQGDKNPSGSLCVVSEVVVNTVSQHGTSFLSVTLPVCLLIRTPEKHQNPVSIVSPSTLCDRGHCFPTVYSLLCQELICFKLSDSASVLLQLYSAIMTQSSLNTLIRGGAHWSYSFSVQLAPSLCLCHNTVPLLLPIFIQSHKKCI